ncbi:MAG TPA: DNA-binding domain-containing protein, partial [Myxococcota bacterium]|nr:DNA-binding domain-containing protein [Myxococcota bacterium]
PLVVSAPPGPRPEPRAPARNWPALQHELWERIIDKPPGFDHGADERVAELFADDRAVRAPRGLRVYSDAYGENLRRALATNFPVLACVLRPDDFAALAADYVRAHPPRSHDYRELGVHLAGFIETHALRADYGVAPTALADVARLEQAQLEAQEEIDATALVAPAALAEISSEKWGDARFAFARALRLVRASHDVLPAVEAVARGTPPPRPERRQVAYLVQRSNGSVRSDRIPALDAALFESLFAGDTFAEACDAARERLGADLADAARSAAALLVRASARGLLAGVSLFATRSPAPTR